MADLTRAKVKSAVWLAGLTFASYINLTLNFRAIATLQYPWIAVTAAAASLLGYAATKAIAKDKGGWGVVGAMIGGALADTLGAYLTRGWG
jgi:hypothetical protein